jgi:hypothetical protein
MRVRVCFSRETKRGMLLVSSGGEEWAVLGVKIEEGDATAALPALHLQGERVREGGNTGSEARYISMWVPRRCHVCGAKRDAFYPAPVAGLGFSPKRRVTVGMRVFFYGEVRCGEEVVFYRWRHGTGGEGGGILDRLGSKAGQPHAHAWHHADAGKPNG